MKARIGGTLSRTSKRGDAQIVMDGQNPDKAAMGAVKQTLDTHVDRPGFDLGGSTEETNAGTGLGLGENAAEDPLDQSLPGQRARFPLSIPRW